MKAKFIKPKMIRILNSLSIDMVEIPQGEFFYKENNNNKTYKIDYDIEVGKYPITVKEFEHFIKNTGYLTEAEKGKGSYVWQKNGVFELQSDANWKNPYFEQTDNNPVVCLTIKDIKEYISWLNKKTSKFYRLPTEDEWEYVAFAMNKHPFGLNKSDKLEDFAWFQNNSFGGTYSVGHKLPNKWGLYDMIGNVWEWCEPEALKGGSWGSVKRRMNIRSKAEIYNIHSDNKMGFRLVCTDDLIKSNKNRKEQEIKDAISEDIINLLKTEHLQGLDYLQIHDESFPSDDQSAHISSYDLPEKIEIENIEISSNQFNVKVYLEQEVNLYIDIFKADYYSNDDYVSLYTVVEDLNKHYVTVEGHELISIELNIKGTRDVNIDSMDVLDIDIVNISVIEQIESNETDDRVLKYPHKIDKVVKWVFDNHENPISITLGELKEILVVEFKEKFSNDFVEKILETIKLEYGEKNNSSRFHPIDRYSKQEMLDSFNELRAIPVMPMPDFVFKEREFNDWDGKTIESKINGAFKGWDGETIFKLMNGQIWKQSRYAYYYTYKFMPKVTIFKSDSGYTMKVEGSSETIDVVRVL